MKTVLLTADQALGLRREMAGKVADFLENRGARQGDMSQLSALLEEVLR